MRTKISSFRWVVAVCAALVGSGCSPDLPAIEEPFDISLSSIVKVSGDNQSAVVAGKAYSPNVAVNLLAQTSAVSVNLQQIPVEDLFPEILKVKLELAPSGNFGNTGITGVSLNMVPNFQTVPKGTMLHWEVLDDGCGRPVGFSTPVDDTAYSVNRWIKGTKAGTCRMRVCRILENGDVVCDQTFVAEQLPGRMVEGMGYLVPVIPITEGDTLHFNENLQLHFLVDSHNNQIPHEEFFARVGTPRWEIIKPARMCQNCPSWPDTVMASGEGWTIVAPNWYPEYDGRYLIRFPVEDGIMNIQFNAFEPMDYSN